MGLDYFWYVDIALSKCSYLLKKSYGNSFVLCSYRDRDKNKNLLSELLSLATTLQAYGTVAMCMKDDALHGLNIMLHYLSGPASLDCDIFKYSISFFFSLRKLMGKGES